ncbi:glycosyltransferase family 2 protein [Sphingobacterium corticibacterium]|uniref:Glycosyltransferase n=1 Tax=Sphingobacterium corticibacterium TaxID=2484746 RepID=A0A4Q6XWC2_9SPHI|nr:glycosyltransferase [Sphingobacterium corticibacterium]RZF61684.1 glycosyltransferase [Sphingobacterium corticibacterium]
MNTLQPIVSVIIPVYNAEDTLDMCLNLLQSQTYSNLELLFINDCSTDSSRESIENWARKLEDREYVTVRIIDHERNMGVAAARNTGLGHATGRYVYYVDADDAIEPDAIEVLVNAAVEHDAEIVGCNWFLSFEKNERKMNQPAFSTAYEGLMGILNGTMRWNLWLFLVERSLYENNNIRFTPGLDMGEDLMVMCKLFTFANRVTYVDRTLYHYRQSNTASLTKVYSAKHIRQVTQNVQEIERFLKESSFADRLTNHIEFLKLNIKLPLLISDDQERYKQWLDWFPEANNYIMQNKAQPWRTRVLQLSAYKKQFWAVQLYYRIINQVVYGILYK